MSVLVTGHCGFVGRHLMFCLASRGDTIYTADVADEMDPIDLTRDIGRLPEDVDRVYHLAAKTDAQSDDGYAIWQNNILVTQDLLAKYGKRVVVASSSMVNYPCNYYAVSKRKCELLARDYGAAIVRFPNLWGEGGHSVIDRFREAEHFIEIRGTGQQLRTYAHVSAAIDALLAATPGTTTIVHGEDYTVNQIAERHPNKIVRRVPGSQLDPEVATQLYE